MKHTTCRKAGIIALTILLAFGLTPIAAFADPGGTPPGGGGSTPGGGGGSSTSTFDYTGTYSGALVANGTSISSTDESYSASSVDENVALSENGGTLTISGDTLTKSGDDTNGDNCNFYGCNSILLAVNSASKAYLSGSTLSASSEGSNGIFATDSATVYANDDTISTTASNSRGLDVTYGGTIIANLMDITTLKDHCATIASDRGGGYVSCTNSTLSTAGSGSPIIYSTGDLEVDNCAGTATGSQIAGMEGLNTILIYNSELASTNDAISGSDPIKDGVILYQSTSGDADTSTGTAARFDACNSTLSSTITSGAMFYCTNTTANVVLSDTTLDFATSGVDLIDAIGNSKGWGTTGSNGATVNFTGLGETLHGNAVADTISTLNMYLLDGTTWSGAASITTNSAGNTSSAPLSVNVGSDSTWIVTGNSTVTNLNLAGTLVDTTGAAVKVVDSSGNTLRAGTGSYTVTVTGSYSTNVSTSSINALSTDYISRDAFDSYYDTSTTFGDNADDTGTAGAAETFSGTDRYDTAARINAAELSKGSYSGVVVACGAADRWADALSGSALAGLLDYPLVLTATDSLSSSAASVLDDLVAKHGANLDVIILGGTSTISSDVADALAAYDSDSHVIRLGGVDRYDTNEIVYDYGESVATWDKSECIVTTGTKFPDALCISPYAVANKAPIILVNNDATNTVAETEIAQFTAKTVIGGTSCVSADIYDAVSATDRLGGSNRYDTASLIVAYELAQGMSLDGTGIATGTNFPDALASGFYLGQNGSVLALVDSSSTSSYSYLKTLFSANTANITSVRFLGGTSSVTTSTRTALFRALGWSPSLVTYTVW